MFNCLRVAGHIEIKLKQKRSGVDNNTSKKIKEKQLIKDVKIDEQKNWRQNI